MITERHKTLLLLNTKSKTEKEKKDLRGKKKEKNPLKF